MSSGVYCARLQGSIWRYSPNMNQPDWAGFFTGDQYNQFVTALETELAKIGPHAADLNLGLWQMPNDHGWSSLVEVAQLCYSVPVSEWPDIIGNCLRAQISASSLHELPTHLDALGPMLRVRLSAPQAVEGTGAVKVAIAEGLVACLAVDLPDRTLILPGDLARTLGVSSEELFDRGLANVRASVIPDRRQLSIPGPNSEVIASFSADDFFTATLALVVREVEGAEPAHGYIVSVPNRHEFLVLPLAESVALQALPSLIDATRTLFQAGPGSISPFLYWVQQGKWARIEFELSEQGLGILGPDRFIEAAVQPLLAASE